MWEINIDEELLRELCPKRNHSRTQVTLIVRAIAIRDGTPGLSLAIGGEVVGEWTDSRVKSLALAEDHGVEVHGQCGDILYRVVMPVTADSGKQLSDTEVAISMQL